MSTDLPPPTASGHTFDIRVPDSAQLTECAALAAERFGFTTLDQAPAWLIYTMTTYGGIVLGAYAGDTLIGCSISFPGFDNRRPFLMSCGLAVRPGFESLGVGMALKLAQRDRALADGYDLIRWTTTSVASRPLYIYLTKLGARLTRFHEDMYSSTLAPDFPDEVEIEWDIRRAPLPHREPPPSHLVTRPEELADSLHQPAPLSQRNRSRHGNDAYLVEVPWDRHSLFSQDRGAALDWSYRVRAVVKPLVAAGYQGTSVILDTEGHRSFVQFEHPDGLS